MIPIRVALPNTPLDALSYQAPEELDAQLKPGGLVQVPLHNRSVTGLVVDRGGPAYSKAKPIEEVLDPDFLPQELVGVLGWVRGHYLAPWGEVVACAVPRWARKPTGYKEADRVSEAVSTPPTLTWHQHRVVGPVIRAMGEGAGKVFLLHDQGEGRFEVYLRVVEEALRRGRSALVVMPEIALTPELLDRFSQRFPEVLVPYHSGVPLNKRRGYWHGMRSGQVRVVVGSRSAVFAPLRDLGLIIVDEEEESSYKAPRSPYYHARDVAVARGRIARAVVLLASLAPSLESAFEVSQHRYQLLSLPAPPKPNSLKIVDMRGRWDKLVSVPLRKEIQRKLAAREPVILFLNRRGFARSLLCGECGWIARCPQCRLLLVYDRAGRRLRCHLCNHSEPGFDECPKCYGSRFIYGGIGTQRLEEELKGLIPQGPIVRLDRDTRRSKGVERFLPLSGPSILLGTRAVIQGFRFPKEALLGVISADTFLDRPDFRASERLFQFLIRAIRRADRVVVQTTHPDSYAIRSARTQNFRSFYEVELKLRRELNYPPFSRLIRLDLPRSKERALEAVKGLRRLPGVEVYGPIDKPGPRSLKSFVLKLPARDSIDELLSVDELSRSGIRVEVDPLEL